MDQRLHEIIKEIRLKNGLDQIEFGQRIGRSPEIISLIERPPEKTRRVASEKILEIIATEFTSSEAEREVLHRKLLLARHKEKAPSKIADAFVDKSGVAVMSSDEGMPLAFIERLRKDLEKNKRKNMVQTLKNISKEELDATLRGMFVLSRRACIELASALGQPEDEYLLLADYMPTEIKELALHKGMSKMFRSISSLTPEEKDAVVDVISSVLKMHKSGKHAPNAKQKKSR